MLRDHRLTTGMLTTLLLCTVHCGVGHRETPALRRTLLTPPFTATGMLAVGHVTATATLLNTGQVLLAGGVATAYDHSAQPAQDRAVVYNPASGDFHAVAPMSTARALHTATLLPNGTVLIAGGERTRIDSLASTELYLPATATFQPAQPMSLSRQAHTATRLTSGQVLITGGYSAALGNFAAAAETYDPASGTFRLTGVMSTGRQLHTATLLQDGRVLIVGGAGGQGEPLASAEIYDPATETFTPTGSLVTPRLLHRATLLASGRVLITGGATGGELISLASTEVYDPATGTFRPGNPMATPRQGHTATRLSNGLVLVTGGAPGFGLQSADGRGELYDPFSGTFRPAGTMVHARQRHTATLLNSGKVLLAGGQDQDSVLGAELYNPSLLGLP
jgi:hypothetical protein